MYDKHQDFFDKLAAEWDLMFTAEDFERLSHIIEKIGVSEGTDVLDIGCGTGILFDMLRRIVGPAGSITGVDFSFKMAEKAHRNFPFEGVNVVDADATNLPFGDETFDMAVAFSSFAHFSDQQQAVEETHRVLKNGARFYIMHLVSSKELAEAHHRIGGVVEHDEMPPEDKLRQMFDQSKFVKVTVEDHPGLFIASGVNSR